MPSWPKRLPRTTAIIETLYCSLLTRTKEPTSAARVVKSAAPLKLRLLGKGRFAHQNISFAVHNLDNDVCRNWISRMTAQFLRQIAFVRIALSIYHLPHTSVAAMRNVKKHRRIVVIIFRRIFSDKSRSDSVSIRRVSVIFRNAASDQTPNLILRFGKIKTAKFARHRNRHLNQTPAFNGTAQIKTRAERRHIVQARNFVPNSCFINVRFNPNR